jgi:hypothetical protein
MPAPSSGLTSSLMSTATGLVSYAQGQIGMANAFVNQIATAVQGLTAPPISPSFPAGGSAPSISISTPPTFGEVVWIAPGYPAPFTGVLDTSDLEVEPFDEDAPELFFGTAPAEFVGTMPDAPPVDLQFEMPELNVELPAPPSLLSLNITQFGGMNMPTLDADEPVLNAVEPSIREYQPGQFYTSALLTTLQTRLQEMANGGSGLGAEAEEALWNRGREREARSKADAILGLEQMEALGFMRPPGGYMDARTKILTETDYADRGHSREVMVESARLALDSVKIALTTAVQLEGQLISYTNSTEQRLFEASRYATEAGVQIYNAKVQAFAAMTDVYRAKISAYEALIRAEVAKVDAYRAQIAAEQAKAEINRALVDQYRVQADVAMSSIRIFEARINAIQAKAEIEKAKVQVFGEQVRGYTAQVNAYTAGVEGYRARIGAETTKIEAYKSKVSAFATRVDASARISDARIAAFKGRIDAKAAEYDGYKAAVQGESARVEGIARSNTVIAESYKARTQAEAARMELLTKQWQATLDQNQRVSEIAVSAAKANAELYITTRSLALDAAKAGAQVSAQIGSAAMNAVNFSGNVSSSEGYQASESVSFSNNNSQSTSTSNSTNYNYNSSV